MGSVEDEELIIRPYYLANSSRRRRAIGDDEVASVRVGAEKLKVVRKIGGKKAMRAVTRNW